MNETTGYSAVVKINLVIGQRIVPVAQLGPDFVLLDNPRDVPPVNCRLELTVDGHMTSRKIHLPDGISSNNQRVKIESL